MSIPKEKKPVTMKALLWTQRSARVAALIRLRRAGARALTDYRTQGQAHGQAKYRPNTKRGPADQRPRKNL